MGKRWGSNEDIHVGDLFYSIGYGDWWPTYQVTAPRGKTQVVLRAFDDERWRNEGRPLLGPFVDHPFGIVYGFWKGDKYMEVSQEHVTAWVFPERSEDGEPILRAVGWFWEYRGVYFVFGHTVDELRREGKLDEGESRASGQGEPAEQPEGDDETP